MLKKEIDRWLVQFREYASRSENEHVMVAINVVNQCLQSLNYDLNRFCISFNGGKDCTVLLHILYMVLMENSPQGRYDDSKLLTLLILMPDRFPELSQFVDSSLVRYNLNLVTVNGPDFIVALNEFKNCHLCKDVTHIFMGTRSTDLSRPISFFEPTDKEWPPFTRVNPLLHWSYSQIWNFLLQLKIPYCSLYDKGYTSLGTITNTKLNPKLKDSEGKGYLPAYMLPDSSDERQGR